MQLEVTVERVWPGREARVEVLGGGITNHNLKVTLDDGVYVLRIAGRVGPKTAGNAAQGRIQPRSRNDT